MAKTKKRTKRDGQEKASAKHNDAAAPDAKRPLLVPHPPRKNLALLLITAALLLAFLVYLAIVAWTAMQS